MKGKLLTFLLVLSLFATVVSFNSPTLSFFEESEGPTRILSISQLDSPIEIASNAELAEQSSAGVGTRNDPYIIEEKSINAMNSLYIHDTTAFFVVRNSEFTFEIGVLTGVAQFTVLFERVEHGIIENCYVRGGDVAIEIRSSVDCSIINCTTYDAYDGILLDSSNNSTIVNCNSFSNSIGIMIVNSDFCNIINNSIYSNSERGVHVEVFCENNTIAGNVIGWNINLNAIDNGVNTTFTDGVNFGNEWSDYVPTENYTIQGTGNSTDTFASLLIDSFRPIINEIRDFVLDIESNGETLTWTPNDRFHVRYQVFLNNYPLELGNWDGREITISLDDLELGTQTILINVIDGAGNVGTDEVEIIVISFLLGGIGTELVMLASGVTVAVFLIIVLIIKKMP